VPVKDRYCDNADMMFADLHMAPYQITQNDAKQIRVPMMFMGGTKSRAPLNSIARTLSSWLADAEFLELDCGHVTYAERPEGFAQAVSDFFGRQ
jgi:pimeloyl-ACP methyl ester carboxylesterase